MGLCAPCVVAGSRAAPRSAVSVSAQTGQSDMRILRWIHGWVALHHNVLSWDGKARGIAQEGRFECSHVARLLARDGKEASGERLVQAEGQCRDIE